MMSLTSLNNINKKCNKKMIKKIDSLKEIKKNLIGVHQD